MEKPAILVATGAALALAATSFLVMPTAHADTALPSPDSVFASWNENFLVTGGSTDTYYTDQLKSKGTERAGTWIGALDILVADDVYLRTRAPSDRQRVSDLVSTFLNKEGANWTSWDGWNDDVAWMITATLDGYKATGNTSWLNTAADQWNKTYNRGWTGDGGGGIWENDEYYSKCALSNDPMISSGVGLYEITGDGAYLTKAQQMYDWMKSSRIVNTSSGVVNECVAFPNGKGGATTIQTSDNAYNAGSWIEAADDLYRATGNSTYRDDAQRTADHFLNNVPVVANGAMRGSSYQYWLFKGMSDFCTDAGMCSRYRAYMNSNAAKAWSMRNGSNLTWNDWTRPTNDSNPDAFEMNGMVGLFQVLPSTAASPFSGDYQIKSATSGLSLAVQNSSSANSAPVVQRADTTDGSASWSFVPQSNGYYEIKNTRSGQVLNVSGASGKPGATVVQWPAGSIAQGNDQWKPVRNADGTWSFYNRNSQFALDDPAGSTASGTQYEQWTPTDGANQRFTLTSRSTGTGPSGGTGPVRSGVAGKCLDLTGGDTANGTKTELWSCNNGTNQNWTLAQDNTMRISGKCLDATGGGTANGTLLVVWDCTGGGNQIWQPYNGGYRNPASGRCIDDPGATTTDGTQLQLWDCNGTGAQTWSLPGS